MHHKGGEIGQIHPDPSRSRYKQVRYSVSPPPTNQHIYESVPLRSLCRGIVALGIQGGRAWIHFNSCKGEEEKRKRRRGRVGEKERRKKKPGDRCQCALMRVCDHNKGPTLFCNPCSTPTSLHLSLHSNCITAHAPLFSSTPSFFSPSINNKDWYNPHINALRLCRV